MTQTAPDTRPLGMTEAYHATQSWLSFIGEPTTRIEDPTDGVVQLYTEKYLVRIRVGNEPATQSAVIAMLRAAAEIDGYTMLLFSPTGYNPSAIEFANLRTIPLFTLTPLGDVEAMTGAARAIMPSGEYEPPFVEREEEFDPEPEFPAIDEAEGDPNEDRFDASDLDWKDCPRCRASQHPNLSQCAACGADLNERLSILTQPGPAPLPPAARNATKVGSSTLQCKNCGSHDIDLVHL